MNDEQKKRQRDYYHANSKRILANRRINRALNRDREREACRKYREQNKTVIDARRKLKYRKRKEEVIDHYGGSCECCGEHRREFLTIDHVNGGGTKHRKTLGVEGGSSIYRFLQVRDYPDGYRVLCMNCNFSMGLFGYCPHQQESI